MLLTIALPATLPPGGELRARVIHAAAGDRMGPGAKLLDFSYDLSAGTAHDCPPVTYYRLILRERGVLRALTIARGDRLESGVPLALLATDPADPADAMPARAARVTVAGIVFHAEKWDN